MNDRRHPPMSLFGQVGLVDEELVPTVERREHVDRGHLALTGHLQHDLVVPSRKSLPPPFVRGLSSKWPGEQYDGDLPLARYADDLVEIGAVLVQADPRDQAPRGAVRPAI